MDETLYNIAETLCPVKVALKDYDEMPIPLEIMELVAMSVREDYFTEIEVWSDSKDKDPFVIGKLKQFYIRDHAWNRLDEKTVFKTEELAKKHLKTLNKNEYVISQEYSAEKSYLIGKWGDVKESFSVLKKKAYDKYLKIEKNTFQDNIDKI